jgi:hypothetical protein
MEGSPDIVLRQSERKKGLWKIAVDHRLRTHAR